MTIAIKGKDSRGKLAGDKYFKLIEHAADGIAIIQDGVFKLVNTALSRISGYDKKELLGMPFTKLLTPQSQKLTLARYQARLAGKKVPQTYEIQAVTKNGEIRDIELNAALTEYDGRPADEVIIRDTTERKQAEEALADEATRRCIMIDQSRDGIVILDENGKVYEANQQFAEMLGYTPEEVRQLSVFDWEYLYPREQVLEMIRTVDKAGDHFETQHRRKDGSTYDVEISTNGAVIDGQKLIFCVCRDVTERKQAEETIHQQNEFLNNILDSFTHPFYVLDANDYTIKMSNLATKAVNLSEKPTCYALTHKGDQPCRGADHICPLEEVRKTKKPVVTEHVHYDEDGNARNIEVHGYPIFDAEGNVVQMIEYSLDITDRKQAEDKLRKSQASLAEAQRMAHIGNWDWDIVKNEVSYSNEFHRIFGRHIRNLKTFLNSVHPDDREFVEKSINETLCENKPYDIEYRIILPDESWRVIEARGEATRDKSGQPFKMIGTVQDITEHKRAEEALRESEEKWRSLVDNAPNIIMLVDGNGTIQFINRTVSGFDVKDTIGTSLYDYIQPEYHDIVKAAFSRVLKTGKIDGYEIRGDGPDGSVVWYETRISPIQHDSEVVGVIQVTSDITERKQMERALKEEHEQLDTQNEELKAINEELQATEEELQYSNEKLERMFESVTDGIVVADLDSTIIKVNEKAVQMHGFASDDELMGKKTFELIAPHDRKRKANNVWNKLKEGTLSGGEYTLLRADGSEFPGELSTSALKDASGKVIGHITTVRDITERRKAEEREDQLEQELNLASRLASIGQLAAGVAHEINNPLTGVIGFSHLMMNRDLPNDMKQDLQVINSEALRVAKIVENLLVFAHQRKTGREYMNINDIITRVLELRAYEMKVNNIDVETRLDPELPLTMADTGQLQQVFLNIVLNAEYFMTKAHNKGQLVVKTEKINGNIQVSFTDDGAGISPENLDKIFNPFFTTKEVGKGTGLGLSICHGIITQHKGRIYAQSESGKGATFVIELPIVAEPVQAGKAEVTKKEPHKPRGAKILVVDDEAAILTFLSRLLTEWGHSVETINTADAALERLKTERYGLILLDIKLPGMSGIELYHHIEKIAPALTRRVMFITGDIMESATRGFLEKSKAAHITKPLDIEVLKKTINHILN